MKRNQISAFALGVLAFQLPNGSYSVDLGLGLGVGRGSEPQNTQGVVRLDKRHACTIFQPKNENTYRFYYDENLYSKSYDERTEEYTGTNRPNYKRECVAETCTVEEFLMATDAQSNYMKNLILQNICDACSRSDHHCSPENTYSCTNHWNDYECLCRGAFGGKYCEISDNCARCSLEGTVENSCGKTNNNKCLCKLGYHGDHCQFQYECSNKGLYGPNCDLQKCDSCNSKGTFKCNKYSDYECKCSLNYEGRFCEKRIPASALPDPLKQTVTGKNVAEVYKALKKKSQKSSSLVTKRDSRRKKTGEQDPNTTCTDSDLKIQESTSKYCTKWYSAYEKNKRICQAVYRCFTTEKSYDAQRKKCKKTCEEVRRRFYVDSYGSNERQACTDIFTVDFDTGMYVKRGSSKKHNGYLISHDTIGQCSRRQAKKKRRSNQLSKKKYKRLLSTPQKNLKNNNKGKNSPRKKRRESLRRKNSIKNSSGSGSRRKERRRKRKRGRKSSENEKKSPRKLYAIRFIWDPVTQSRVAKKFPLA